MKVISLSTLWPVFSVLLTLSFQGIADELNDDYNFVDARLIDFNDDPVSRTVYTDLEGWTWVNFIIDSEGKVGDILLLDHSERTQFIDEALEYVRQFKFEPATLNGKPIESHRFLFLRHSSNTGLDQNKSAGEAFAEGYGQVLGLIARNELQQAKLAIEELKGDFTFNLARQAWISWLNAMLSFRQQDYAEYLRQLMIGYYLADSHLSNDVAAKLYMNLFEMQMFANLFLSASDTIDAMVESDKVTIDKELQLSLLERVVDKLESSEPYTVELTLYQDKWNFYRMLEDELVMTFDKGSVERVSKRCEGLSVDYTDKLTDSTERLAVSAQNAVCDLFVKGKAGQKVSLQITPGTSPEPQPELAD